MSIDIEEFALLGAAIFSAQKLEFALYGLAAHVPNSVMPQKEKRFQNLTPEIFLRGNPTELKATLGQLVGSFGDKFLIRTSELDKFVDDRNFICHGYWRATRSNIRGAQERKIEPVSFLTDFLQRCDKYISIVNGFIASLIEEATKRKGDEPQLTDQQKRDIKAFNLHAEHYFSKKNKL